MTVSHRWTRRRLPCASAAGSTEVFEGAAVPVIDEIKTTAATEDCLREENPLHWPGQDLRLHLCRRTRMTEIGVQLTYARLDTGRSVKPAVISP